MKILVVHNSYKIHGGEDNVVDAEIALMRKNGHEVSTYFVSNSDRIISKYEKIRTAINLRWSKYHYKQIFSLICKGRIDVVHVHNTFPLITPSVFDACSVANVPVVFTLHNFRLICSNGLLLKRGKVCEQCLHGSPYRSFLYGCYRDSHIGSVIVANSIDFHKKMKTWLKKVDRFIALTEFAKNKFVEGGLPESKIVVKSNFYSRQVESASVHPRDNALFVGRLSKEKGVNLLLEAWSKIDHELVIIGDGPMMEFVLKNKLPNVRLLGLTQHSEVISEMQKAKYLVMPSNWYEGFPMVLIEAYANGLPVIAADIGSLGELVEHAVTGLLFQANDVKDLRRKIKWANLHDNELSVMGENARERCENKYSSAKNYDEIIGIYESVIREKRFG